MAGANVHDFTDENFQSEVINAPGAVLVDFWAEWCAPCKMLSPVIDRLADRFAGKVKVGKVNTDKSPGIGMQFGIIAIPTVILFKDGKPVKKFVGLQSEKEFVTAIEDATK
jgi:thioredoxin 1